MTKETQENLRDCGRETALNLLNSAVSTAKTQDVLTNQIYVAYFCGVHILATEAFNHVKQGSLTLEQALERVVNDVAVELRMLNAAHAAGDMIPAQAPIPPDKDTTIN